MAPFEYSRYQSPYTNSIAQLMERSGEIPAQAAQQVGQAQAQGALNQGAAWSGAAQNIGQTMSAIPGQIQHAQMQALQARDIQAQIKERTAIAAQRESASQGLAAVDAVVAKSMKTDPDTGVASFDRSTFEQGLAQSGQGHLYPQYAEMLDKLDASAAKRNAESRQMLAQTLYGIAEHGYTPQAVVSGAAYLKANRVLDDEHITPILGAIGTDPSPENIKATLSKISDGLPEYSKLVESDQSRKAALAKTAADTAKAAADAAKTQAEVSGTLPATPGQAETLRHNQAMEQIQKLQVGREAAANAETARHNRATELAANPLAALTGQPTTTGGQPPQITGDDFLKTLANPVSSEVKALAEGRMAFPSGFALKSPYWQSMLQMVSQYDPTFDASNFNARSKARADLTSPNGTGGKTINALNTAIQHAGKLSDLIEALGNNNIPLANTVANAWNQATGGTQVTNFNAVQPQLMKEIERAWRGTGGSQADIEALRNSLSSNAGIQQQREALNQFVDLMKGKLSVTETQRDNALGKAGAQVPVLFDQSKAILAKIEQRALASGPAQQAKTLSVDQVKKMAELANVSYADAKKYAESQGYTVK